ncbi:hypothetical protein EWB00_009910, partial [Schistosoma japonicum]
MENNVDHLINTTDINSKSFHEKIQRNHTECNHPWNILSGVIEKVKQECFERVKHLEQENLLLQQRYKELEERVLPLTTSLNGQEYSKEFLKCLYSTQMNPTDINFKLTPNDNAKNSDTIEQLTNLLLYTNISQKYPLNLFNKTLHSYCQQYTLPLRNSLLTDDLCVHTTETTTEKGDMNSINNVTNNVSKKITNSYHPIEYSSSNYSYTKQQINDNDKNNVSLNNPINCFQLSSIPNEYTTHKPCQPSNTDTIQMYHVHQMDSIHFNWLRSESLPDLQYTNINCLLNESCYRTNSLIKLSNSSFKSLNSNHPMTCRNKEMMLSSGELSQHDTTFNTSNTSSTSQLTHNINIRDDLIIDTNKHNIHWLNRPLPKGWKPLQNLSFNKILPTSTGTHGHIILGTRSLPLICNKSIENRKKISYSTLLSNDNSILNSCKYSHSYRNLHVNNVQLNTIIEVDSSPSSFHDSLANKVKCNNDTNDSNENSNNNNNDINNKDNIESNQCLQQEHEEQMIKSIQYPKFYVSPDHSIESISTSKQILLRDQKLRYQYPLRSTVISSNHNLLHVPRSYDLETHINYHDTFRKLHNAREHLKFSVFSDTELLTGKFTITSTDDSAIDSGDDDLP